MNVRRGLFLTLLTLAAAAGANNFLVSESAYRTLSKAEEQIHKQQYARAVEILDGALGKRRLNDYERALFERLAGNALIGAGDHAAAVARFEAALAGAALPDAVRTQLRYTLAQLYVHESRYNDVLALLREDMDGDVQLSAAACFLIASAYAALERLPEALEWGERGLERSDAPGERRYAFVANLNVALERYPRAAELFEQLIAFYPQTAQHWRQLSAVYIELERDDRALAVAELGHLRSVLTTAGDVERLARLYLQHELPHKAAALLEDALRAGAKFGVTRYRLLANAWIGAREYTRAVTPLGQAAKLLHESGDTGKEARVRLRKGIVHAHLEQHDQAAREFKYCLEFEETRDAADKWLDYLAQV